MHWYQYLLIYHAYNRGVSGEVSITVVPQLIVSCQCFARKYIKVLCIYIYIYAICQTVLDFASFTFKNNVFSQMNAAECMIWIWNCAVCQCLFYGDGRRPSFRFSKKFSRLICLRNWLIYTYIYIYRHVRAAVAESSDPVVCSQSYWNPWTG